MHNGETMDVYAPFSAFPGGALRLKDPSEEVDGNKKNNESNSFNSFEHQELDVMELAGGEEGIADNVDGFLDDFVALVGSGSGGDGIDAMMDGGDVGNIGNIGEEDLAYLEDMDPSAFLPPPSAFGGGEGALPSAVSQFEPLPVPTAAVAAPEVSGIEAGVAPPPLVGGEASNANAVDKSAPAAGVVPVGAAGAAPAVGVAGGVEGRNDFGGGGVTIAGGDAGFAVPAADAAASAGRKEQLRKHKVARYLEKKKRRRWSKASAYQSRQRVANNRPRHKGRFLPLESDFVPIAEMQRRQRALVKEMQEKAAAAARAAAAEAQQQDLMLPSPEGGGQVVV